MSLLDVDTIDYVGVNVLFKRVYVGIFDDLDWDDEATHFSLLTKKIDRYTQYVRSGQLLAAYPSVRGYPVIIEYVAMRPMTRTAEAFWKTRETIIRAVGFEVRCRSVDVRHATAPDSIVADVMRASNATNATNTTSDARSDTQQGPVADVLDLATPAAIEAKHSNEIMRVDHHPVLVMRKKTSSGR
jgi:hypothetical protein